MSKRQDTYPCYEYTFGAVVTLSFKFSEQERNMVRDLADEARNARATTRVRGNVWTKSSDALTIIYETPSTSSDCIRISGVRRI